MRRLGKENHQAVQFRGKTGKTTAERSGIPPLPPVVCSSAARPDDATGRATIADLDAGDRATVREETPSSSFASSARGRFLHFRVPIVRIARPIYRECWCTPVGGSPIHCGMDKLVQFGRKAWFIVRVMSGYEERRIRSYRLQLQKRLEMAQARKEELRKQPEQMILSEVRQVVQQMQALNQHLEEAETAIDEYFKPIDKNAKLIMDMQLEKEENQMKQMAKVMQEQAKMRRELAMRRVEATSIECKNDTEVTEKVAESPPKQEAAK